MFITWGPGHMGQEFGTGKGQGRFANWGEAGATSGSGQLGHTHMGSLEAAAWFPARRPKRSPGKRRELIGHGHRDRCSADSKLPRAPGLPVARMPFSPSCSCRSACQRGRPLHGSPRGPRRLESCMLLSHTGFSSSQARFRPPAPEWQVQRLADNLRVHH